MSLAPGDKDTTSDVQDYYGKRVQQSDDLELKACTTTPQKIPKVVREALKMVHDEVCIKYYGCGMIIPEVLEGRKVLDLGSGAGRDCFMLAKLVGEGGYVTGLDMTKEQLAVANKYVDYHREKFGYAKANTNFVEGYIEKLTEAGIQENFYDIIVSNCVVNLSPDKRAVLQESYKVLKEGGELYFSDIYADRRLTEEVRKHKVLWGECISGALWWQDLFTLAKDIGFTLPRYVTASKVNIDKPELREAVGDAQFVSVTYRLFKLGSVGDAREVIYEGDIPGAEDSFTLDHKYTFKRDEVRVVDGETARILSSSRYADYFSQGNAKPACCPTQGDWLNPFDQATAPAKSEGCCC